MLTRAPAPRRRSVAVRSMLTASGAVLGATLVIAGTAGGTYGLWAESAPISAGIVNSGSLSLTVNGVATAPIGETPWNAMFPGDLVKQTVTVKNTGTVTAEVTVAATSTAVAASDYTIQVKKGGCPSGSTNLDGASVLQLPSAGIGAWSAEESATVCVQVALKADATNASNGAPVPFTVTFSAAQKAA